MTLPRRAFLHLIAGAAGLSAASRSARAQSYPTRPLRLLVGFPPGGGVDITARLLGQWLSERLGQQVVIDNRAGAGGNIATEAAVRASPDGYTLLLATPSNAINATLYSRLNFDFIRDISPVAGIMRVPLVMEVNPSFPATTVPEFIAYTKANPSKINMASAGTGTSLHMSGQLFKIMTGVELVHVPYRGGAPALTDLMGGRVQVIFSVMPETIEYVRAGKLRALAVTTASRSGELPDVPSVAEFVPGYEASSWYGVGAPKGTPVAIVEKLNREVNAALADAKMKSRFADLGGMLLPGSPADFGKFIAEETEKWAKVVKLSGAKAE
jgi:tripartite-type tricarboxylate transporter receptor subunit TctC